MNEYTLALVNEAIAAAVASSLPGVTIYDNPNQQDTRLPAVFLTYRGEQHLEGQMGNRALQTLRFDLAYLEDLNLPDLGDRYRAAAEALDAALETVVYADGLPLRCTGRRWYTELDGLHYQFELKVRLSKPADEIKMTALEKIKEGLK